MKKMLVLLMAWFLLGQIPLEKWSEISDQDGFMSGVAQGFSQANECNSEVVFFCDGENVFVVGRCLEVDNEQRTEM